MYEAYKDRAAFLFVYITEAHASDEWQMPSNEEEGIVFEQPRTWADRRTAAEKCCASMKLDMPCVVDDIENTVDQAYAGWPERIFIVDGNERIAYAGKQGPWGFKPAEAKRWLRNNVR